MLMENILNFSSLGTQGLGTKENFVCRISNRVGSCEEHRTPASFKIGLELSLFIVSLILQCHGEGRDKGL